MVRFPTRSNGSLEWSPSWPGPPSPSACPTLASGGSAELLDVTSLGAHTLLYSAPFGISLALTGWLRRNETFAVCGAVALSGLAVLPMRYFISTDGRAATAGLIVIASVVVCLTRAPRAAQRPTDR